MELAPEFAEVKRDGKILRVPVRAVKVDEIIVIRPGDKVPLDGVIVEGVSSVNQASITGESMPVLKIINEEVYAGSINNEGYLEVKVTKLSSESVLSKIVEFVTLAQLKKSPTERFIDKFSKYYTPAVVLLAILLLIQYVGIQISCIVGDLLSMCISYLNACFNGVWFNEWG